MHPKSYTSFFVVLLFISPLVKVFSQQLSLETINLTQAEAIAALPKVSFIRPAEQAHIAGNTPRAMGNKDGLTKEAASLPPVRSGLPGKNGCNPYAILSHPPNG